LNTSTLRSNETNQTVDTQPVGVPTPPVQTECYGPVCGSDNHQYATNCDAIRAGVEIAINGTCLEVAPTCVDSDNGLDAFSFGRISKSNTTYSDTCLNENSVLEYTCINNEIANATIQCSGGMNCQAGICRNVTTQNNSTTPPVQTGCVGPNQPNITVSSHATFNGVTYSDSCVDYRTVKDYYCQNGVLRNQNENCPAGQGCVNGACAELQSYCRDTDGGIETLTKGKTSVSRGPIRSGDVEDECLDSATIREQYCLENGSAAYTDVSCGNGRKCDEGRCTRSACTETDDGKNYYQRGTTTSNDILHTDQCTSERDLLEYFCEGDNYAEFEYHCTDGKICQDGACVPDT
jgi:hypothetical protein